MRGENDIDFITARTLDKLGTNWSEWKFRCTGWEKEFIEDCLARFKRYGKRVSLSAKQRNRLSEIKRTLENDL